MSVLMPFAEKNKKYDTYRHVSLGQYQDKVAESAIEEAQKAGTWVILENCHLYPRWMPKLSRICDDLDNPKNANIHPSFRLWLTTYMSDDFPQTILQNSVKMSNEPPEGLATNLLLSYSSMPISDEKNFFENNPKGPQFKRLLYSLCMFHAVVQERRSYGSLGWNKMYEFNSNDLRISCMNLFNFIRDYEAIPWEALHYMIGECNYGGRVTEITDRLLLNTILVEFMSQRVFYDDFLFSDIEGFGLCPAEATLEQYKEFVQTNLPGDQPPELFGFHANAQMTKSLKDTSRVCSALLNCFGSELYEILNQEAESLKSKTMNRQASNVAIPAAKEVDETIMIDEMIQKLPKPFKRKLALASYPVSYKESLNTVLLSEVTRYNTLLKLIMKSLGELKLAMKGLSIFSETLE
jgi:dynein heavy chain